MKHITRLLARLYPSNWRKRYGAEFDALLEDAEPKPRDAFDILWGVFRMQISTWTFGRIIVASSVAGLSIAGVGSLLVQDRYESQTVVRMSGPDAGRDVYSAQLAVLREASLKDTINRLNLYPKERERMPIEQVIEKMKGNISIFAVQGTNGTFVPVFGIRFEYPDRLLAQRVTQDLTTKLFDAIRRPESRTNLQILELPFPATSLGMNRTSISGIGLLSGASLGLLIALVVWPRRRNRAGLCPTCGRSMPLTASPRTSGGSLNLPSTPGEMS